MPNALRNMTRMGADMRQIAAILQSQGRGRDTVLAHITPQEAALLKARGGAGTANPVTGLPEFQNEYELQQNPMGDVGDEAQTFPVEEQPALTSYDIGGADYTPQDFYTQGFPQGPSVGAEDEFQIEPAAAAARLRAESPFELGAPEAVMPEAPAAPIPAVSITQPGISDEMKTRLGVAGIQTLGAALTARRAAQQAQRGAQDISKLGAPYRQKGQELMSLAQQGGLTPGSAQQVQALRAQLAQQAAARGGVGAQQAAGTVERFRQQLLEQQFNLGLKLSGVSDQFALRAIQAGMSADQTVNQLLGNTMMNIGRLFAPQPRAQVPGTPPPGG
jgi:hypothetical protein